MSIFRFLNLDIIVTNCISDNALDPILIFPL